MKPEELEQALEDDDGSVEYERLLSSFARDIPHLNDVPTGQRAPLEEVGAALLYRVGMIEELVRWIGTPTTTRGAIWLTFALFDLGEYSKVASLVLKLDFTPMAAWVRSNMLELLVCCYVYSDPTGLRRDIVERLRDARASLDPDQVTLMKPLYDAMKSTGFSLVERSVRDQIANAFAGELEAVERMFAP